MAGKAGIILSLLGKLDDAAEKTVGKKVSKAKVEKIDAERVKEALDQKLIENPQYLEELSDKEYKALMRALPAKSQANMMGDDYAMEMYEQQAEAAGGMTPKEAAENLSLFQDTEDMYGYLQKLKPQQLKEFKENVSEEDINLYGPALDRLETLTPRAIKMAGGKMKNDPFKVKYNEGSMLVAPEMGLEDEMPEDTYDNIPEDEKEAAEASQLPDDEMEQEHLKYVLNEALPIEDQEYLMDILDTDERLNDIFDKVISTATEFSGAGEVDGPGTGTSDSIPARLSDGEFVFTKKATDQLGADKLQTMMDEAEKAYDGGLMKKAFGGMVDDMPVDQKTGMYDPALEDEEIRKQMIDANQMPSVRNR
jgi:hypothetical protein